MKIDYTYFYKRKFESTTELKAKCSYDIFISSFNSSDRVVQVFSEIRASRKIWLVLDEYKNQDIAPSGQDVFSYEFESESEIIRAFIKDCRLDLNSKICIDITGFLRPHLAFLVRFLHAQKVSRIDFLYTDPARYLKKEQTTFASIPLGVDQIKGYMGSHNTDANNDLLIIGVGYDSDRITEVAKSKAKTRKVLLFGFPSLQPDFFQENVMKAYEAEEASAGGREHYLDRDFSLFAPANDPFVTAQTISDYVREQNRSKPITNLYLSPLSTKVQALGMCLYYIWERVSTPTSIIFAYSGQYESKTSEGITRISIYTCEFPRQ